MGVRRIVTLSAAVALLVAVFSDRIQSRAPGPAAGPQQQGSHRSVTPQIGQRPQLLQARRSGVAVKTNLNLPLAVDGRKNPERVPDRIAYNHFIGFNAESASPTPNEMQRRNTSLARVGLSPDDHRVLVEILKGVRDELRQADTLSKGTSIERAAAKDKRDDTLARIRTRIQTDLSPDGVMRLDQFIRRLKLNVRIYGAAPSA